MFVEFVPGKHYVILRAPLCLALQALLARRRVTAELRGAIGRASAQQLFKKKKKDMLSPGRAGGVSLRRCGDERSAEV